MAIHRATATSGSVVDAQARFREPPPPENRSSPSYSVIKTSKHVHYTSSSDLHRIVDNDPTLPLLPTTRFHSIPNRLLLNPPTHAVLDESLPSNSKPSSGVYLGVMCLLLIWLVPIAIVMSGTVEEVASESISLSGWFSAMPYRVSVSEPNSNHWAPLVWDHLKRSEHCLRYKTREYTAKSNGFDGRSDMEVCKQSTAIIHGVELKPTFCENLGNWGGIWGHWIVNFSEPECETSWVDFKDEGCQGTTGYHRFLARMDHFNESDDWQIMCSTTPTTYSVNASEIYLPPPTQCEYDNEVITGTWNILDESCQVAV